jgi:hypothetical protein
MNDLVYSVRGGMEDWAYAGSWDPEHVIQCVPETYGGYPAEKTQYDQSTLRAFNMLVETSNEKIPPADCLGSTLDIMTNTPSGNGHVARNIRLALLAAELVEPYVRIGTVNELDLSEDTVPLAARDSCQAVAVPHNSRKVVLRWTVGGALAVDETALFYAKWDAQLEAALDCSGKHPNVAALLPLLKPATAIGATAGVTQFGSTAPSPPFSASVEISDFSAGDKIVVIARAKVDQAWGQPMAGANPSLPPQSHLVNARTNPEWRHEKPDGKVIQGRLNWYSMPVTIELREYKADKNGDARVEVEELSLRYDESMVSKKVSDYTPLPNVSSETSQHWPVVFAGLGVVLLVTVLAGRVYLNRTVRKSRREQIRDFIEDESAVSPGLAKIAAAQVSTRGRNGYSDIASDENGPRSNGEVEMERY